jgi:hypothetical protein
LSESAASPGRRARQIAASHCLGQIFGLILRAERGWSNVDHYVRNIEDVTLPALRHELDLLESGAMHTGKRDVAGPWVDTTLENIDKLKRAIAEYESILASLRKGESP